VLLEWSQTSHINNSKLVLQATGKKEKERCEITTRRSKSRSWWPCGLRFRSTTAGLLGLRLQIPPAAWMSVSCVCCVLSGKRLCDGPIPSLEVSYRSRARVFVFVCVCACVSLSVTKAWNIPLYLKRVGKRGRLRQKGKINEADMRQQKISITHWR